ncbi:MAG: 4Fe-4S dicluster domain-containing protein [Prevotella sp.]|nr:4Fe-4S dicluster domain-containing protein [Prevotella sp.]
MKRTSRLSRREWLGRMIAAGAAATFGSAVVSSCGDDKSDGKKGPDKATGVVADLGSRINCINCGHCMPCDFGVDIPGVFVFYNAALEKGIIPSETSTRSETRRFLSEYDSTIPDASQAHRCITCYHCAGKCPQNIFIARQMERITELTESLRDRLCTDD